MILSSHGYAREFYVDPETGLDHQNGDLSTPFKTIAKGITKLDAGDTLILRKGRYLEKNTIVKLQGTDKKNIVLRAMEGELVILDGRIEDFQKSEENWELFDAQKGIYISQKEYPNLKDVQGYIRYNDQRYKLINYHDKNDFYSQNENFMLNGHYYTGPGVYYDNSFIFIRLQRPQKEAIDFAIDIPQLMSPNEVDICLTGQNYGFVVDESSFLVIDGIQFENYRTSIRITNSQKLQFKNIRSYPGKYSFIFDDNIQDVFISGCSFDHYQPDWVAWSDVKIGEKPSYSLQDNAIEIRNGCKNFIIKECYFKNVFDGIAVIDSASKLHITKCYFENVKDDCLQLGSSTFDIEFDHNLIKNCFTAFSRHGSGKCEQPGLKFFHHNIIDSQVRFLAGRRDPLGQLKFTMHDDHGSPWVYHNPISQHNYEKTSIDPWKIYNNTFIFGRGRNRYGAGHTLNSIECDPATPQEVYNNVFVQIEDGEIARGAAMDSGCEIYDGNVYFRKTVNPDKPMFFGYKNGGMYLHFNNLSLLKTSTDLQETKEYYSTGWEKNSIESDPELGEKYVPAAKSPCLETGVKIPLNWPDALNSSGYRGALKDSSGVSAFYPVQ